MKISDVISWVDEVKPNAFPDWVKLEWISALEGRIAADVFLMNAAEVRALAYKYPADMETELLVEPPHDDIYGYWVQAKIDEANGEYTKYVNTLQIYNGHYSDFVRWFANVYAPAQGYRSEENAERAGPRADGDQIILIMEGG